MRRAERASVATHESHTVHILRAIYKTAITATIHHESGPREQRHGGFGWRSLLFRSTER
jgi:hypothetical protein